MSIQQENRMEDKELEHTLVRYLRDHPGFFEQHLDLLGDMILPHVHGGTVSLVERQVSVLREQKEQYRRQLQQLLKHAEKNEKLSKRFNELILALLDARELAQVIEIINLRLQQEFEAEAVSLRLFNTDHPDLRARPEMLDWSEPVLSTFEKVIGGRHPVCGTLPPVQVQALFNDAAEGIQSSALIPLLVNEQSRKCYGLLAIGSYDAGRFRADMGTLFLSHLGKVLARVLSQHLE
ncbi:Protein of unknown function DUF484 [hydrothermal vent metagenome]|uniref:DUF484 family protein n=1 Tax=hydrothermal vent metagenome TaxID=652676 RepID=A0A3B1BMX8_9ZZZZ